MKPMKESSGKLNLKNYVKELRKNKIKKRKL